MSQVARVPTTRSERRVAVVGAGFGGLAAALRLQAAGIPTTLFEALETPGGRAGVVRTQGFTFDTGPTVITAPSCFEELFAVSGKPLRDLVELRPVEPFYRVQWADGERFDYGGDADALETEIGRLAPDDLDGYRRFLNHSRQVFDAGYPLVAHPFLRITDMLRVAPQLVRLRADRSVYHAVARYVADERLRQVLSFHSLLIGGNPFEASSIYTLIHFLEQSEGVHYVQGGTWRLAHAIADRFVDLGGALALGTPVRRIDVSSDGAHRITTDHDSHRFDAVVSNADVWHTYSALYADDRRAAVVRRRLSRAQWSNSLFLVYFGADRRWPDLAHHTILLADRYRGLLHEIFHGNALPEDFSLYLHAPSVSDSSVAPPGCSAFYALCPVPHLGNASIDWDEQAPRLADRILASLEGILPGLRSHIVVRQVFTPDDFERRLAAPHGAAFSLAPNLLQSAWFRPHNRDPRIPGLYLVGAGTHPGAGLPGVVNSAKATVDTLLGDWS